jgi:hypothetical protein
MIINKSGERLYNDRTRFYLRYLETKQVVERIGNFRGASGEL